MPDGVGVESYAPCCRPNTDCALGFNPGPNCTATPLAATTAYPAAAGLTIMP